MPEQIVSERVHGRPLVPGIVAAALRCGRKQFDGVPVFAGHEMTDAEHAAGAHRRYTPADVAELLGVSVNTVRRWTDAGRLACLRVGMKRERRFRRADLLAFFRG